VGESKALNDKTVIYRDGCICLDPLIITKTNLDTRDLHSVTGVWSIRGSESSAGVNDQDDCQKTQPTLSNNRNQDTFQLLRGYTPVALE
jgi:hypothetical protein